MSQDTESSSQQLRQEAFELAVEEHHSHNFVMMVAEGALFIAAAVLYSGTTVLSGFMTTLGAGGPLIGLTVGGLSCAWTAVQLYSAFKQGHLPMKRRVIMVLRLLAACTWIAFAGYLFFLYEDTGEGRRTTVWILMGTIFLFALLGGYSVPLWMDFVGKIFRADSRGRYYGWRNGLGALIGLGVSVGVLTPLLKNLSFPYGYAWSLLLAGIFLAVGSLFVGFSREAPPPERRAPARIKKFIAGLFETWKVSLEFRFFVVAVVMTSFGGAGMGGCMATPFFMKRAIDDMGAQGLYIGLATVTLVAGQVIAGLFSGRLVDRAGAKLVFFLNMLASSAAFCCALFMPDSWLWPYLLVFLMTGTARGMMGTCYHNCIMEMVPVERRPESLGLVNFMRSPSFLIAPYLGGVILSGTGNRGYTVLFAMALVFSIANVMIFLAGVGLKRTPAMEV